MICFLDRALGPDPQKSKQAFFSHALVTHKFASISMAQASTCYVLARTQSDATAMKETLRAQQQLLQKLYAELDQEREASATAASEAMDMILRLQGEMAAVKMEASHYKRMAEEKISHAEATLEAFEELIYQKEMEIASLEFQVQAYKRKLVSLGCDLNASEFELPEDPRLNTSDQQDGENGQSSTLRRLHSMPLIKFKNSLRVPRKRGRSNSPIPVSDVIPETLEEDTDQEVTPPTLDLTRKSTDFVSGTLDSYLNQIKKLDEKVKVLSDCNGEKCANSSSIGGRSCSIFSQASSKMTSDQTDRLLSINSDKCDGKTDTNPSSSVNVHDVFEVPHTSQKQEVIEFGKKWIEKWHSEAENRLRKPYSLAEGMVESDVKHDTGKQKSALSVPREIKTPSLKHMMAIIGQQKEGLGVDGNLQAELEKMHQRIERLERERTSTRQEITHEGDGEEQLRLLKDLESQLKLVQLEMRSWKTKKATPKDDVPLGPLQEAMLHFWL